VTWIVTQFTFCFATAPFLILSLSESFRVWSHVYFYAVIWTVAALGFFASPAKVTLRKQLEKRNGRASARLVRSISTDSITGREPILGISKDPEGDINEAIEELKAEVERKNLLKPQSNLAKK
jgi:lysophospholipid acyltransferase